MFGFIMMTPQLFINYKLKSVAHLPWRVMSYKAFNTFIDDVFSFIITMPTMHRIACLRDDVVFAVFLYQKWIYRVDMTRTNEYGYSYEHVAEGTATPGDEAKAALASPPDATASPGDEAKAVTASSVEAEPKTVKAKKND